MESVLVSFDGAQALPRLGGMARPDGVAIVSERFWAFAGVDGTLREGAMPAPRERLGKVPLVRGLVRLGLSVSPLFRRGGVAKPRERLLLAVAVAAPLLFAFLPHRLSLIAGLAVTVGLIVWLLRGRTLALHGAEHRAIAAAEERRLAETWRGAWLAVEASTKCFARAFLLPGLGLQRITTREPRLDETRVALRAVESVLSRELAP
ncbi:MAG: hypothetical protein AUG88_00210 [Actinobacteria bacterium 13_1_20CM_4_68_12]|nr:MAG: hypothetical protein AUG88_00210 [Actinobacteria bacterium 13_1_20CM_4_68_12]